jgi:hypothetical protein
MVPVPLPLSAKLSPVGRVPAVCVSVGAGNPVVVMS